MKPLPGRSLVAGTAEGAALVLDEPLSLWGGLDPRTGEIIDHRHPQRGKSLSGRVCVLPWGRGSSSSSSILLEAVRLETAPAAILLREADAILALGAAVARELYDRSLPVVVLEHGYGSLVDGELLRVHPDGAVERVASGSAKPGRKP